MKTLSEIEQVIADADCLDLPRDVEMFEKVKFTPKAGMRVGWYFEEDKTFWEQDSLEPRDTTSYSGIIVPKPDIEAGRGLAAEDCIIVMDSYPCEKHNVEVTWLALRKLIDNPDLVEIFPFAQ